MQHARKDYDHIQDPDSKIPDDEPVFLIRGQDPAAQAALAAWVRASQDLAVERDTLIAVNQHAQRMKEWAAEHPHGPATVPTEELRIEAR